MVVVEGLGASRDSYEDYREYEVNAVQAVEAAHRAARLERKLHGKTITLKLIFFGVNS